jgi:hypothetical protein
MMKCANMDIWDQLEGPIYDVTNARKENPRPQTSHMATFIFLIRLVIIREISVATIATNPMTKCAMFI